MKNIHLIVASWRVLLLERNYLAYSTLSHDGETEPCALRVGHSMWECIAQKAVPASHSFGIK